MPTPSALLASIPPPPFQNLDVGPLTLHGYGLIIGIAIIAGLSLCEWGLRFQHVDTARFTSAGLLLVLCGFIGGRLYHVASEPIRYANDPARIPAVWEGGLGIYGAVLAGALFVVFAGPRFGLPPAAWADAAAPALLLGQAIGRWGNYVNQELFGGATNLPWGLEVTALRRPAGADADTLFHPTFLYESVANLLLCGIFLLLLVRWTGRAPGVLAPLYVAAYSVVRILVEPLRIDPAHEWLGVRQNVWVAGTLIILGLAVAAWMQLRHRRHQRETPGLVG